MMACIVFPIPVQSQRKIPAAIVSRI
ncbi:hypothetical protein CBM2609_A60242 [Cupriavidus taiwanensis]|nr:hypothetical protein CBM2604_A50242 [Cupriavidus taiwanensis]SOZ27645.1 hypothetical protein CBM2609_A60242 [Cupriavidus taiwanensis]SOZ45972.1 hypothetical protein CBM2610_A70240 [Cupriavidus taiwanensis]